MPNSSTESQVLELYYHIQTAMDNGKQITKMFLNISKAFDKVWYMGLFAKLEKYKGQTPKMAKK